MRFSFSPSRSFLFDYKVQHWGFRRRQMTNEDILQCITPRVNLWLTLAEILNQFQQREWFYCPWTYNAYFLPMPRFKLSLLPWVLFLPLLSIHPIYPHTSEEILPPPSCLTHWFAVHMNLLFWALILHKWSYVSGLNLLLIKWMWCSWINLSSQTWLDFLLVRAMKCLVITIHFTEYRFLLFNSQKIVRF